MAYREEDEVTQATKRLAHCTPTLGGHSPACDRDGTYCGAAGSHDGPCKPHGTPNEMCEHGFVLADTEHRAKAHPRLCGLTVEQEDGQRSPCAMVDGHSGDHKASADIYRHLTSLGILTVRQLAAKLAALPETMQDLPALMDDNGAWWSYVADVLPVNDDQGIGFPTLAAHSQPFDTRDF